MLGLLTIFFAGLWPVLWPLLLAGGIVIFLLMLAYFSPLGKRYFVEAAIVAAIGMSVYQFALHQADERCRAQNIAATKAINKVVNKAVKHTHTQRAVHAPDPWNQKDY